MHTYAIIAFLVVCLGLQACQPRRWWACMILAILAVMLAYTKGRDNGIQAVLEAIQEDYDRTNEQRIKEIQVPLETAPTNIIT